MKLVEVVAVYPPYRGGIGTVSQDNVRMALDGGWDVVVCTPLFPSQQDRVLRDEIIDGVQIKRLKPALSYGNAAVMLGLLRYLHSADVIHLQYPCIGSEWLVILACAVYKKKLLVTYHMNLVGKGMFRAVFMVYTSIFLPLVMRYADHVFVTSWDYAQHSHIKKFMAKDKTRFSELPCVVDSTRFYLREKSLRILEKYRLTQNHKIVLFVGGLDAAHYFKGVDLLIDAFSDVATELPDSYLIIVGSGNLRIEYEHHVRRFGLSERIYFAGSVSDAELPLYYSLSDVCVLPSTDESEAFGIALVEAMACGKPVIASNIRGVRSVVRDGIDGILITPCSRHELRDALGVLLVDNEKRTRMGESALENAVQRFSYNRAKMHFQKILSELV